jgi:hypothetical protein
LGRKPAAAADQQLVTPDKKDNAGKCSLTGPLVQEVILRHGY